MSSGDDGFHVHAALPIVLALACSAIAGLTSFGDAICFHVLWAFAGALGLVPAPRSRLALKKAVMFITVMGLANQPLGVFTARRLLKRAAPYGATMAITGISMVPVGARLLFYGDLTALKYAVGSFFIIFSVLKLTGSVAGLGAERKARRQVAVQGSVDGATPHPASPQAPPPLPPADDATTPSVASNTLGAAVDGSQVDARPIDDAAGLPKSGASGTSGDDDGPVQSPPAVVVVDGPDAPAKGVDVGSTPPPIDAPATLVHRRKASSGAAAEVSGEGAPAADDATAVPVAPTCDADASQSPMGSPDVGATTLLVPAPSTPTPEGTPLRPHTAPHGSGVRGCLHRALYPSISPRYPPHKVLLVLLVAGFASGILSSTYGVGGPPQMLAFAVLSVEKDFIRAVSVVYGVLELGARIYFFTSSDGAVFEAAEWPVYLGIALAAWTGFAAGTWLRRFADTDAIIRVLLLLVFASSAILLGALDENGIAAGFGAGAAVWIVLLVALFLRPPCMEALLARLGAYKRALAAALCCCCRGGGGGRVAGG